MSFPPEWPHDPTHKSRRNLWQQFKDAELCQMLERRTKLSASAWSVYPREVLENQLAMICRINKSFVSRPKP